MPAISSFYLAFDFVNEEGQERENKIKVQNLFYDQTPEALLYNFHLTKMSMFILVSAGKRKIISNIIPL